MNAFLLFLNEKTTSPWKEYEVTRLSPGYQLTYPTPISLACVWNADRQHAAGIHRKHKWSILFFRNTK